MDKCQLIVSSNNENNQYCCYDYAIEIDKLKIIINDLKSFPEVLGIKISDSATNLETKYWYGDVKTLEEAVRSYWLNPDVAIFFDHYGVKDIIQLKNNDCLAIDVENQPIDSLRFRNPTKKRSRTRKRSGEILDNQDD